MRFDVVLEYIYALNCYALRTYILQYRFSCTKSNLLCTQNEKTSLDPKLVYNLADDILTNNQGQYASIRNVFEPNKKMEDIQHKKKNERKK